MANRRLCAVALLITAAIHLAVVPEHARAWPAAAVFFVLLAVAEVALARAVLGGTSRRTLLAGAAISAASAVVWATSRTVGLPLGPEAFSPEAIAAPDVLATGLEAFAALVFVHLALGRLPRPRALLAAPLVLVALLAGACGGDSKGASSDGAASAEEDATSVAIDTFMFTPKRLHVDVGATVTWTNEDDILHTVTSGTREYDAADSGRVTATDKDGAFDMQLDGRGATARTTFDAPGTFHYFCDRHPGMEADIDVS
jgi:plastocyanin